jgi:2-alkenal reductase
VRANSGVGFAIPINIVQRAVPALIKDGVYRHAWLGISGQTYSPAWAEALGFSADARGAYIMTVRSACTERSRSNGPAKRAGLAGGDRNTNIVLDMSTRGLEYLPAGGDLVTCTERSRSISIDGRPVKTFDDLLIYLESFKSPNDTVTLRVLRPGQGELEIPIVLGERPQQQTS